MLGISNLILGLPRIAKRLIVISIDICMSVLTTWIAYYLRLGEFLPLTKLSYWPVLVSICIAIPIFIYSGLYREIFRYGGWLSFLTICKSMSIYALLFCIIFTVIGVEEVPRTLGIIQPPIYLFFIAAVRLLAQTILSERHKNALKNSSQPRVLIYGAGKSGRQLAASLVNSREMKVVGFIDDDYKLQENTINGLPVHSSENLIELVQLRKISKIILAMPSITRYRRNEILHKTRASRVEVLTISDLRELSSGDVDEIKIHELDIDDLLARSKVDPDLILMSKSARGKVVMVAGAGGTIGGEICIQICNNRPTKLILLDNNEFALYTIHQKICDMYGGNAIEFIPLLGTVQDEKHMREIMSIWQPDTVYHAAAYKHVPLVEYNILEGIKNNIFGTLNIARAAIESGVSSFVLISTDKAVRPTNIMGASKRIAEEILQAFSVLNQATTFSMVRFGNVLDSSGSVVPKFRSQIRRGGPITITHNEVTRYFMTISEAAQLVIQAGAMASGGEVFILDMGEPVKILDLAKRMVDLSGLTVRDENNPYGDLEIKVVGLRPGEKLYEELLIGDNPIPTEHKKIMKASEGFTHWQILEVELESLFKAVSDGNISDILEIIRRLVPSYMPSTQVVDLRYVQENLHH